MDEKNEKDAGIGPFKNRFNINSNEYVILTLSRMITKQNYLYQTEKLPNGCAMNVIIFSWYSDTDRWRPSCLSSKEAIKKITPILLLSHRVKKFLEA